MTVPPSSGNYVTIDGTLYFVTGKTRIKVTEHFPDGRPTVTDLMEDMISHSAKSA